MMHTLKKLAATALLILPVATCGEKAKEPAPMPSALLAPGLSAMESMEYAKALTLFREAEKRAPYDPKLLFAISQAHAALGQDALAGIYLSAHLKSWKDAPGRAASEEELQQRRSDAYETGSALATLATDMAIALPEEEPSPHPLEPTAKQRIVERVLGDLVMTYDLANAERLAAAHPRGATMAIGAAAGRFFDADGDGVGYMDRVLDFAIRIAKLEARSPDVHYIFSQHIDGTCTMPHAAPCPDGAVKWNEPPAGGPRETATEGVLLIGLSTWAYWVRKEPRSVSLFDEGRRKIAASGNPAFTVIVPGMRNVAMVTGSGSLAPGSSPRVFEAGVPGSSFRPTDPMRALRERALPTGEAGEYVAFDDALLADTESLVSQIGSLPPGEAVLALSTAARKLKRAADRLTLN